MKKITLIVVDDHKLVREMFLQIFSHHEEFEIIGETGVLEEAVEMVKAKEPHLVFLDINLGNTTGFDAMPLISKHTPQTKVIALSLHNNPAFATKMIGLGAKGYITKNSSSAEIFTAIKEVIAGKTYICSEIKDIIAEQIFGDERGKAVKELSAREMEVIKLISNGCTSKDIAEALMISVKTVEGHRYNILKKLNQKNTATLMNSMPYTELIGMQFMQGIRA